MRDNGKGSEKAILGASGLLLISWSVEVVLQNSLFALPCHSRHFHIATRGSTLTYNVNFIRVTVLMPLSFSSTC